MMATEPVHSHRHVAVDQSENGCHTLWGAASIGSLLLIWEAIARLGWVPPLFLPAPSAVVGELAEMIGDGTLWAAVSTSLLRILWGFLLGAALGVAVGLAVGVSRLVEVLVDPLLALLYPIPKIAMLPLIILWLGIGEASKVGIIAIGVFFPACINTIAGVKEVDRLLVRAAVSLGARPHQVLTKVILIGALPFIFSGLRLGAGMALLLVVSAEMIAATQGLGFLILHAGELMMTTRLMAGIVVLSFLGIVSTSLLKALEQKIAPWKGHH
jgi:NitT/TauT family transport system permease protein